MIIATIAIPNLVRSHQAADEAAAVSTLRAINTAEVTYLSSAVGNYGTLGDLVAAGLLDSRCRRRGARVQICATLPLY